MGFIRRLSAAAVAALVLSGCAVAPGEYMQRQQSALSAALARWGIGVTRQGDDLLMAMPDVTFDTGRSSIKADYRAVLDDMALVLTEYDASAIEVVGHADATGGDGTNQRLSERRAQSVADYLNGKGVASARIQVRGAGESEPVASNETPEGRAQNRRVEIRVSPQ